MANFRDQCATSSLSYLKKKRKRDKRSFFKFEESSTTPKIDINHDIKSGASWEKWYKKLRKGTSINDVTRLAGRRDLPKGDVTT